MTRIFPTLLLATVAATPQAWNTLPHESAIVFSGTQAGGTFEGWLPAFTGSGCFDPADPKGASGKFIFDLSRATTGVRERDEIMRAPEWLDTAKFPQAIFAVSGVKLVGDNAYEAEGVLTLKGKERPFTVPFATAGEGRFLGLKGRVAFDRRDFNVGEGEWGESEKWVGFQISVDFQITSAKGRAECKP